MFWTNALQGFGFGLAFTPMTVLAFATLPAHQITEASGVFTLVRNFGVEPVHLGDRRAAGALDRGELFAPDRVHLALQQGAVVSRSAGSLWNPETAHAA